MSTLGFHPRPLRVKSPDEGQHVLVTLEDDPVIPQPLTARCRHTTNPISMCKRAWVEGGRGKTDGHGIKPDLCVMGAGHSVPIGDQKC